VGQESWKRVVSSDHSIMRQNALTLASSGSLVMYNSRETVGNRRSWKEGGSPGLSRTLTGMDLPGHGAKPRPRLERAVLLFLKCFNSLLAPFLSSYSSVLFAYCVPVVLLGLYWKI